MKDEKALIDMKKLFLPSSNYWKVWATGNSSSRGIFKTREK